MLRILTFYDVELILSNYAKSLYSYVNILYYLWYFIENDKYELLK